MSDEKEILLNIMYSGTYLEQDNIGHEIINLFKDDNGNNYIYVLPYGTMAKEHNDKIDTILLVRRCNSKVFEILAKATDLEQIVKVEKTHKMYGDRNKILNDEDNIELHKKQIDEINKRNISYGGVKLYDIFKNNKDDEIAIYATFKAKEIIKVKTQTYITVDNTKLNPECTFLQDIHYFPSQSPKMYISNKTKSYQVLQGIINNKNLWESENTTKKINFKKNFEEDSCNSFIEIIKKSHDELVYSNLLAHFFKIKPKVFCKFAKAVLNIEDFGERFEIVRESEKNIDLLIKNDRNVIVIENKIKSGINGICDNKEEIKKSQLSKYFKHVEEKYQNVPINNRRYFILSPNYNHIDLQEYACGENYKLIDYKKVFDFFEGNKDLYNGVKYFDEFLSALKVHTKQVDNSHEEEMHRRFSLAISKLK